MNDQTIENKEFEQKVLKLLEEEIFKKVTAKINRLTQLIQPILIVFIGIIVVIF